MKVFKDISYCAGGNESHTLNIYLPEKESFPVFVYFHGGGLEHGSKDLIDFPRMFTERGVGFVSAEYRMYPMASYPDFIKDAAAAVAYVKEHIAEYCRCEGIYVGGSSAGAYLSMMLCFDSRYLAPYEIKPEDIDGYIHDAGQCTTHFNVLRERGIDTRRILVDEAAPLYHVCADKTYAPMFFIISEDDMPNRLQETELMISALKTFGYDMSKIKYKILPGTHSNHAAQIDENGDNMMIKMISDFILQKNC